ncbi:Enteropeptidase [Smittium mucronatum]|uniref:Enteropeptidase n=1 Tax=Smittium mucronatum TaxID=133383 RepID=A0A1R0H7D5_9FUNG|nr:Enteropeptidase [Smittium mucronatum]
MNQNFPVDAAGWGQKSNISGSTLNVLLSVPLKIPSSKVCSSLKPTWESNDGNLICVPISNGKVTCFGDSDGSLAYPGTSPMSVVGLTSFGISDSKLGEKYVCGSSNGATYYKHVINYIDWIVSSAKLNVDDLVYNGPAFNGSAVSHAIRSAKPLFTGIYNPLSGLITILWLLLVF